MLTRNTVSCGRRTQPWGLRRLRSRKHAARPAPQRSSYIQSDNVNGKPALYYGVRHALSAYKEPVVGQVLFNHQTLMLELTGLSEATVAVSVDPSMVCEAASAAHSCAQVRANSEM